VTVFAITARRRWKDVFNPGDRVTLLQGERRTELQIDDIAINITGGQKGEAGHEATLYILQKGLILQSGDLIGKV